MVNLLVFVACLTIVPGRRRRNQTLIVPAVLGAVALVDLVRIIRGLLEVFELVAQVSPADKATILAAGISEVFGSLPGGLVVTAPVLLGAYLVDRALMKRQQRQPSAKAAAITER